MDKEKIIKEFAERIKSQLLKNNNKLQTYEVDYIAKKMLEQENFKDSIKDKCETCIHKDGCGIDDFFMEELDLSEEERFKKHCVGCCCGDGCECNKHSWDNCCDNWEDGSELLQG